MKINDDVFGVMEYNHRWLKEENILIWGKELTVNICARSYNEKPITTLQKQSYKNVKNNFEQFLDKIQKMITEYIHKFYDIDKIHNEDLNSLIKLTHIIFFQDGETIMIFDFIKDVENGIGVKIIPDFEIGPQDTFI